MKILSLLLMLLVALPFSMAAVEYHRSVGESASWQDRSRLSHGPSSDNFGKRKSWDAENRKKKKFHRSENRSEGHRRHFNPFNKAHKFPPVIIYRKKVEEPRQEVEEETATSPRYITVPRPLSPQRCAGDIIYLRDKTTGEVFIRYVSSAGEC